MHAREIDTVLLDIDGTLVDSNSAHAHAWVLALDEAGFEVPFARLRRLIGKAGAEIVPEVTPLAPGDPEVDALDARRASHFRARFLPGLRAWPGGRALCEALARDGRRLVAATASREGEAAPLLRLAGVDGLVEALSEPGAGRCPRDAAEAVRSALAHGRGEPSAALLVGDTPHDVEAARRVGVACVAFTCGGWSARELLRAGAAAVYEGPADLLARLSASPLAPRGRPARAVGER